MNVPVHDHDSFSQNVVYLSEVLYRITFPYVEQFIPNANLITLLVYTFLGSYGVINCSSLYAEGPPRAAVADIPMVPVSAPNRGEHQPKLQLETDIMRLYPNPLSLPKSTKKLYPMNSQKHGVALIINNKKFSEGRIYEIADCDEVNLTETLKFLGYDVQIKRTCSRDVMTNLFEQIEMQCLDPAMKSGGIDSFICCIISHGNEEMVYGADNKPIELKKIQEAVKNCKLLKKLPKLFFIQAYLGKQVDPTKHLILSKHSDFYFSCAIISSEQPFRDPKRGSLYVTELCKALCTHSTDMVLSDIVGIILKAKLSSHSPLLKEDNQLKEEVYFFHGKFILYL